MNTRIITILFAFVCTCLTAQTTLIERHGITWEFAGSVTHGTFVNGDPWVVGPANLLRVLPETTTDSNGDVMHGSMLDPGLGTSQGYDSRIRYNTYYPNLNIPSGSM